MQVRWTTAAANDLENIADYLFEKTPENAPRLIREICGAVLALGRAVRYSLLAFLGARYGRHVLTMIAQHGHPVLIAVIGLIVAAVAALIFHLVRRSRKKARK